MGKLFFASLVTLGILLGFVFGIVILVLLYTSAINIQLAIELTVVVNILFWLFGPYVTDIINKYFYDAKFFTKDEFTNMHPEVAQIIDQVATAYSFSFPKIAIIPDNNPTAFTYGSARYNARIVLTEGIFTYLNPAEARAVVAHELGHIVNRDFIVMMIASTLVQILYEIYATLIKARGKQAGAAKLVAVASYVLYMVGLYLIYYLSRTREYLADKFSASITPAQDLSNALIKIAYGIVVATDDKKSKRLLESTRHLGIIDVRNAKHYGITSYISHSDPNVLAEVMVFDKISPWASLIELSSTHPLTGKRIDHLSDISKATNQPFTYDIDAAITRMNIDRSKLFGQFSVGLFFALLPYIFGLLSIFFLPIALFPASIAVALIISLLYKFPYAEPIATTVLEQMRNPYASPIRGRQIALNGQVIGRGVAGYVLNEDMMYQDSTGLIFLDYTSAFGWLGNLFFALSKIKTLFSIPSQAVGWFYRGMGSTVSLKYIDSQQGRIRSHPILWSIIAPVILLVVSWFMYTLGTANLSFIDLFR